MSSFCGVISNKPAKKSTPSTNSVCDFKSFQDLERDIKILYDDMIALENDFKIKSEAIQEWQYKVYENSLQVTFLNGMMNYLQGGLEETENSLRMFTGEVEKLEMILQPIKIVADKTTFHFDSQRHKLYFQFLDFFNEIDAMKSALLSREELIEFVKVVNFIQIILYHIHILENIEKEIYSLNELQEINDNMLKYIENDYFNNLNNDFSIPKSC